MIRSTPSARLYFGFPNDLVARMADVGLDAACIGLNLAAWSESSRDTLDGLIPARRIRRLVGWTAARERYLTRAGFWMAVADGISLPEYLDVNRSREAILDLIEKRASAGRIGGRKHRVTTPRTPDADPALTLHRPDADPALPKRQGRDEAAPSTRRTGKGKQTAKHLLAPPTPTPSPSPTPTPNGDGSLRSPSAREAMTNLSPTAIAALEARTGEPASRAGDRQLTEFDRLIGRHGLEAVLAAFDQIREGSSRTARELIWPAVKVLEPFQKPKRTATTDAAAEVEEGRRRAERAKRVQAKTRARAEEIFHFTGKWDRERWGEPPVLVPS